MWGRTTQGNTHPRNPIRIDALLNCPRLAIPFVSWQHTRENSATDLANIASQPVTESNTPANLSKSLVLTNHITRRLGSNARRIVGFVAMLMMPTECPNINKEISQSDSNLKSSSIIRVRVDRRLTTDTNDDEKYREHWGEEQANSLRSDDLENEENDQNRDTDGNRAVGDARKRCRDTCYRGNHADGLYDTSQNNFPNRCSWTDSTLDDETKN